ncbi:MAG: hypothetical protein AAB089_03005, partial [Nitrospirota bacterium]
MYVVVSGSRFFTQKVDPGTSIRDTKYTVLNEGNLFNSSSSKKNSHFLPIVLILLISVIIYSNTFYSSFHLDDFNNITDNPSVKSPREFLRTLQDNGRPVLMSSFLINYLADNFNVSGYHAVNLLLHALNGILLYFILYKTLNLPLFKKSAGVLYEKKIIIAALASLIFVSHPIQTESVTYITSRSELLVTFFYLTALLLFINYYAGPVGRQVPEKRIKKIFFYIL